MKKVFYFIVIIILTAIYSAKLGFFDCSKVQIDNLIFDKPMFYRLIYEGDLKSCNYSINGTKKINLNSKSEDSRIFTFMGIFDNSGGSYTVMKKTRLKSFNTYIEIIQKTKGIHKLSKRDCKVFIIPNYGMSKNDSTGTRIIYVARYPYIVSFSEINKEREEKTIEMICGLSRSHLDDEKEKP